MVSTTKHVLRATSNGLQRRMQGDTKYSDRLYHKTRKQHANQGKSQPTPWAEGGMRAERLQKSGGGGTHKESDGFKDETSRYIYIYT